MRTASIGQAVFASTMIAVGVMGLLQGGFAPIWESVPRDLAGHQVLAYLCACVCLASGLGLFWKRSSAIASRVLFAFLLLWFLLFKIRLIVSSPAVEVVYESSGEMAVFVAGAWMLYARFATGRDRRWFGFAVGDHGTRIARALFGLALVAFGLAHFFYLRDTTSLVPAWLPWHVGWACLTGTAYLAAGASVLTGIHARLAASLATVQMGLFTLLVWGPRIAAGHMDSNTGRTWNELVVSWTLMASAWVIADSYRSARRPALRAHASAAPPAKPAAP